MSFLLKSLSVSCLQGGVDDEVTLSAYITIALLEMPLPVTVRVLAKALLWMQ